MSFLEFARVTELKHSVEVYAFSSSTGKYELWMIGTLEFSGSLCTVNDFVISPVNGDGIKKVIHKNGVTKIYLKKHVKDIGL